MEMREVSSTDQPGDIEEINTEVNRALQQEYGSWNATNGLVVTWKMSDGQAPAGVSIKIRDNLGAQWLSGRVLDSRPKGRGFEPHRRHCVVVLEQDTFILA